MTIGEALHQVTWYLKEVSGESDYGRYVAHRRHRHPDEPVISRRDFESWRMDDRDSNPRARCC